MSYYKQYTKILDHLRSNNVSYSCRMIIMEECRKRKRPRQLGKFSYVTDEEIYSLFDDIGIVIEDLSDGSGVTLYKKINRCKVLKLLLDE